MASHFVTQIAERHGISNTAGHETPPIRIAVIGCGAITQQMHLPVLAGHAGVDLVALVDRDQQRARHLAQGYGVSNVFVDAGELEAQHIDAAIVATPPFHHAPCAIELMRRGIHVLVEKPMATNYRDAVAMVETANEYSIALSVGLFRRLFPSVRLLKGLLDSLWLGQPIRFEVEGGGMYNWQATTLANMRKDWAGGGVLIDFGSHMLDLLFALFDEPAEVVEYCDNALGGVEADCSIRLRLHHQGVAVEGTVELARTRNVGNLIHIMCERGSLGFEISERFRVWVKPHALRFCDPSSAAMQSYWFAARSEHETEEVSWYETFRTQIDDWLEAIRTTREPQLSGRSVLSTVKLIEACYQHAKRIEEPWVFETFSHRSPPCVANRRSSPRKQVLVTGATGFIGCRVAEILCLRHGWNVRALVHNPANASRLARLPIEIVQGDLRSENDALRLVEGCDALVHCAVGTAWGQRREIFAVTVDGTRKIAQAALEQGVGRFVHLSTMAVYGDLSRMLGVLDESTPVCPVKGSDYSESKIAAERVLQQLVEQGLSAVILRPARVFGPFSQTFITRPLQAIAAGHFCWLGQPDVPCDMVYVDNLVEAIVCGLEAPDDQVKGETFTVSDGEAMTWREFYTYFARRLGLDLSHVPVQEPYGLTSHSYAQDVLAWPRSLYRGLNAILTSKELRALGQRVLRTDPWGRLPRLALESFPSLERFARRCVNADDSLPIYRQAVHTTRESVGMGSSGTLVSLAKARRVLGYGPPVSREYAMELTLNWVKHARLIS